jgi:protein TonB
VKYALPAPVEASWERPARIGFIVVLHLGLALLALSLAVRPQLAEALASIELRVIEDPAPRQEPQRPLPPVPMPQIPTSVVPLDLPVLATESPVASPSFAVAPQPAPPPQPVPVAASAVESVVGASFDADYLHNPAPSYPYASRRNGEQGRSELEVLVSTEGLARTVRLHKSSGFPALDEAAIEAVRRWRFVPARRGGEVIEDWVLVPVAFHLHR